MKGGVCRTRHVFGARVPGGLASGGAFKRGGGGGEGRGRGKISTGIVQRAAFLRTVNREGGLPWLAVRGRVELSVAARVGLKATMSLMHCLMNGRARISDTIGRFVGLVDKRALTSFCRWSE